MSQLAHGLLVNHKGVSIMEVLIRVQGLTQALSPEP